MDDMALKVGPAIGGAIGMHIEGDVRANELTGKELDILARAAIEAHTKALADAGLVIVPREPTEAMFTAADAPIDGNTQAISAVYDMWNAMIDAALEGE